MDLSIFGLIYVTYEEHPFIGELIFSSLDGSYKSQSQKDLSVRLDFNRDAYKQPYFHSMCEC